MIDGFVHFANVYIQKKRLEENYSRDRYAKLTGRNEICAVLGGLYLIGIKRC